MRKILFFLIILCFNIFSFAQQNDNIPEVIPRSPEAELYMRYGEIPVGLSTGIPGINIPIYTIKTGGLELPINISYHASGNKLSDVSGVVGLGWVLNAGGLITQSINGIDDFYSKGDYKFLSASDAYSQMEDDKVYYGLELSPHWQALRDMPYQFKTLSDRFSFNFGGYNGSFFMDMHTKEYKTLEHIPMQIKQTDENHFTITDPKGNIWTFKRFRTLDQRFNTGYEYHVLNIKPSNSNEKIEFEYITGESYQIKNPKYTHYAYFEPSWSFSYVGQNIYTTLNASHLDDAVAHKGQTQTITPVLVKKIKWGNNSIDFDYKKDQKSKYGSSVERLDNILVKSDTTKIKTILYNKDSYLYDKYNLARWAFIDSIQVNADIYSFTYNKGIIYPDENIKCNIDFWGYYNGRNSENLLPLLNTYTWPDKMDFKYAPDRESNPDFSQIGIIKEMKYPTKGRTEFYFENNKGTDVFGIDEYQKDFGPAKDKNGQNYFGGLRIKCIKNYDKDNLLTVKSYEYEGRPIVRIDSRFYRQKKKFVQIASGYIITIDYPGSLVPSDYSAPVGVSNESNNIFMFKHNYYMVSSSSFIPITNPWGQFYFYSKVIEYTGTEDNNNGKTEYYHNGPQYDYYSELSTLERIEPVVLTGKKIFRNNNNQFILVQETINSYKKYDNQTFFAGVSVEDNNLIILSDFMQWDEKELRSYISKQDIKDLYYNSFKFHDIFVFSSHTMLEKTDEITYTDKGPVKSTTKYTYDPKLRTLSPINIQTFNSKGDSVIEQIKFPFNFQQNIFSKMLSRNMIDYPIEKLSFIDNKEILRQKTDYNTTKDNLILPSAIQSSTTGENGLQPEITFDLYDSRGNILQYTARDGVVVSFVWGYGQQYPVAKIVNATYDEVKEALNRFDNDLSHLQNYTDTQLITELNKLRTKLNKAHVYTYTYKPLVGMVSETDSNGIITEYDYDSFGRLLNVFDKDKNILKQFEYHYKNQ